MTVGHRACIEEYHLCLVFALLHCQSRRISTHASERTEDAEAGC